MSLASEVRRIWLLVAVFVSLAGLALAAQPAAAQPRVVTGGETRLEVNTSTFIKLINAGIYAKAIPPAYLEYGGQPAAVLPIRNLGLVDSQATLATVGHDGGLRLYKPSTGVTVDTTNITTTCAPLAGCRLLATANGVLPNEVVQIRDSKLTDDGAGTVTLTGVGVIGEVTALALNTLFDTQVFKAGMELAGVRSSMRY
jgi:hypothetical protein